MAPNVFELTVEVTLADLDELNHVNNQVYFRYLQEAAIGHWYSAAPPEVAAAVRWVVRRHEIDYLKPAFLGDSLLVKTWIETLEGVTSIRRYEIWRGLHCLVKACTHWVALDAQTLRPKRLPADLLNHFTEKLSS